ncbi:DoxX family protein [Polluticoccus soli]|uniref:DoxX family protein n=1 Tax=Polluticoccus soli TaxID=3034150 RepID=UPI0023E09573|nr:DoxX family protein [Flavipsychrobacter sp. JY13-12]
MKKTNIIYWSVTLPFVAFMLSSAIPNMLATPDWIGIFKSLGYPEYLVSFVGFAKFLGIVAILVPGFPRVTEWAYAGLAFDIILATYSVLSIAPNDLGWLFMIVVLLFLFTSYIFYHKRLKLRAAKNPQPVFGAPVTLG